MPTNPQAKVRLHSSATVRNAVPPLATHILQMIVNLPKDGAYDSILVIVDSFTKYVILVECSKKLKLPNWQISSYDIIVQKIRDRPHFSSAYHPQSNGQTERVNPTVEHFLRAYSGINQRDWYRQISVQGATWMGTLTHTKQCPYQRPKADNMASQMESQWREIEAALRQSKTRMTAGEGEPISFEEGEEAWLDARNVKLKT
ncbi:hypothetical protein RhiXN_00025 [Rhizoctonia solani]|uniref:Integrase catalytic domain-containing protein n=1 Tax=Rhizoctonia solani TaxID=456999 RepID=A0A8H8NRL3_9AGAM|nr:uncharacterized protein RhiXN_00025 [Rhizoctonia solani]QRW18619.1 hypothetical protein RhiXN_00025 [Rhizoctonia solani]